MGQVIAIAGKGGTGKTIFSALLIRELANRGVSPILAVDADANYNLGDALGLKVSRTLADVTDEFMKSRSGLPQGMTKEAYLEMKVNGVIIESKGLDLLVMGRPEGAGCYCYINNLLKAQIGRLMSNYRFTVIDNEAGMEHISRRTTPKIDLLFIVADCSAKAIRAASRIKDLTKELDITVERMYLVLTKSKNGLDESTVAEAKKTGLELAAVIPEDMAVAEQDVKGLPIVDLPPDSAAAKAVRGMVAKILLVNEAMPAGQAAGVGEN